MVDTGADNPGTSPVWDPGVAGFCACCHYGGGCSCRGCARAWCRAGRPVFAAPRRHHDASTWYSRSWSLPVGTQDRDGTKLLPQGMTTEMTRRLARHQPIAVQPARPEFQAVCCDVRSAWEQA
jgi:hypothetical protein